ncbi:Metallo-dependent hydrolase [Westerdykella ornata]|uniref:Metallo-dependent hydrolase n=1 Tax=Westerdykella ornata TaxID=318751 RepID=A0A6A6JT56_WESOR|nr:Metallo-dependent hydrolase [Westerdykella ornata]KAF2279303.1 Metallo-dependent hydrolase [Westerdykella ornata]
MTEQESFPWHLGVFDAHCHPTDTMSSISSMPKMKTRALTVMATRSEDQDLVASVAKDYGVKSSDQEGWKRDECILPCFGWHPWFSYQMYISEEEDTDKQNSPQSEESYENQRKRGGGKIEEQPLTGEAKLQHYRRVLLPSGKPFPQDQPLSNEYIKIIQHLPDPTSFRDFLVQTRHYLQEFPFALIGEIGLDRAFRIPEAWAHSSSSESERDGTLTPGGREGRRLTPFNVDLGHQKRIMRMQLDLAAEMGRAVSVHGVQAHGMVYEVLAETWAGWETKVPSRKERKKQKENQKRQVIAEQEEGTGSGNDDRKARSVDGSAGPPYDPITPKSEKKPYPPRICLHSYSGDPSTFKRYLSPNIPAEIFASFSTAINLSSPPTANQDKKYMKFEEMIRSVPDHMLLVESDLHTAGDRMDEMLEDIVRRVCTIKSWGLDEGTNILKRNWRRFVFGKD